MVPHGDVRDHDLANSPTADYAVVGIDDEGLSTGVAGLIGLALTGSIAAGLFFVVRRIGGGPAVGDPPRSTTRSSA